MLTVTVRFWTPVYHGTRRSRDGAVPDWPPSPLRLFQGLVSAGHLGRHPAVWRRFEPVLRWWERLGDDPHTLPTIHCAPTRLGDKVTHYQPGNHRDTVADKPDSYAKTMMGRSVQPQWSAGNDLWVRYTWPVEVPPDLWPALSELVARLPYLGQSTNSVRATVEDIAPMAGPAEVWVPSQASADAHVIRVPCTGTLDALDRIWDMRAATIRENIDGDRPSEAHRYSRASHALAPVGFWLTLPRDGTAPWPRSTDALWVAAWLRHRVAVVAYAVLAEAQARQGDGGWAHRASEEGLVRRIVEGHGNPRDGASPRIGYLPLPTILGPSDHIIRRVALAPFTPSPATWPAELWHATLDRLPQQPLTDPDGRVMAQIGPPIGSSDTDSVWAAYFDPGRPRTRWSTVTPVVLPGFGDPDNQALHALEHAGYDRRDIAAIRCQRVPFWAKGPHARDARVAHYMTTPRYHVQVDFHEPISGPVSLGRGRYMGVGLLAGTI